jgi:hypothetical protein
MQCYRKAERDDIGRVLGGRCDATGRKKGDKKGRGSGHSIYGCRSGYPYYHSIATIGPNYALLFVFISMVISFTPLTPLNVHDVHLCIVGDWMTRIPSQILFTAPVTLLHSCLVTSCLKLLLPSYLNEMGETQEYHN